MEEEQRNELFETSQMAASTAQQAQSAAAIGYYVQEKEKGLAETQLEVETIISEIHNLLKQNCKSIKEGRIVWEEITNKKNLVLTETGVERIMQLVNFYVNKNVLLSNFSEEQINRIMLRFCSELNDLILLKYQTLFAVPTFEECKIILGERMDEKAKLKQYGLEIIGEKADKEEIKKGLLKDIEFRIEKEMEKIKQEARKEKLREYGLMMAQIEMIIYATLNRAWKGEERGSIRRHTNISEIIGNHPQPQRNEGGMFRWLKQK